MRSSLLKISFAVLLFVGGLSSAMAFTLSGPKTPWMVARIGYPDPLINGPMTLGAEYRWTIPTMYYGYSRDFLDFFGQRGIDEIEKAIAIINALPAMSKVNIDDYPLAAQRINQRAQALNLIDLKSATLNLLLFNLGLDDPYAWVYTLRTRYIGPGPAPTNYWVIRRNFDPQSLNFSPYINGQLWTYTTITDGDTVSATVNQAVDPLALGGLLNAPVASQFGFLVGGFYTGFTRDDIGGLKYIYRKDNYNYETAPIGAFSSGFGGGSTVGGSPWGIPGAGSSVGGVIGNTNNFVNTALRPGIDKISLVRINPDSVFGNFPSNVVAWTDTFITNGRAISQTLQRPVQIPDILFNSADLLSQSGQDNAGSTVLDRFVVWQNNDLINGEPLNPTERNSGPGQVPVAGPTASVVINFDNNGPVFYDVYPQFLSEPSLPTFPVLASFDGTTNEPIIYPQSFTIYDVERLVLGGGSSGGGGGTGGGFVAPWTPVPTPVLTNSAAGSTAGGTGDTGTP